MKRIGLLVLLAAGVATPALAGPALEETGYAADAIAKGNYSAAEAQLRSSAEQGDVAALVNLAEIYHATNRSAEADRLYREILQRPRESLATTNGWSRSSHTLARAGLKRMRYAGR